MKIDKGVDIPDIRKGRDTSGAFDFLAEMRVGDSYFIPMDREDRRGRSEAINLAKRHGLRLGMEFTSRWRFKEDEERDGFAAQSGLRIWRVS